MIDAFELKDLPNIEVLSRSQDKREDLELEKPIPLLHKGGKPKVSEFKAISLRSWTREWQRLYLDSDGIFRRRMKEPGGPELQEVFHVYWNKFEIGVSHLFLIIFSNKKKYIS